MQIEIDGGTDIQQDAALKAIQWAATYLMGAKMAEKLEFEVNIREFDTKENALGWCVWIDKNVRPKAFEIEIEQFQSPKDFLLCLMHEMVHVKQFVKGEMKERYKGGHKTFWLGTDCTTNDYKNQPWEAEAYGNQEMLLEEYVKTSGHFIEVE